MFAEPCSSAPQWAREYVSSLREGFRVHDILFSLPPKLTKCSEPIVFVLSCTCIHCYSAAIPKEFSIIVYQHFLVFVRSLYLSFCFDRFLLVHNLKIRSRTMDVSRISKQASSSRKGKGRKGKRAAASNAVQRAADARVDKEMFTRFEPYIATLYDPEHPSVSLAPSVHTHQGESRRKPFVITYTSAVDDETVVFKMYPRPTKTIVQSMGGTTPAASTNNQVFFEFEGMVPAQTVVGMAGRALVVSGGAGAADFELPIIPVSLGGHASLGVEASTPATIPIPILAVNRGDYGLRINPYYRNAATSVWTALPTAAVPAGATIGIPSGGLPDGTSGWGMNVHNASDTPRFLKLTFVVNNYINGINPGTLTYPAVLSAGISALDSTQALDEFRTVAMMMRLTCMGDLTTTAGQVACAMVPREFVPDPDDVVGSIASLPVNSFEGKLIDGCDVIWQPRTEDDFKFQAPEFDKGSYYLIIAARLAHADTPIRLKASYNYEIFTLDPNLGNMRYCPSAFGLDEVTQVVFSTVPPGSSNDGHKSKLAAALAVAKRVGSLPLAWLRENPDKAMEIALGIASKILAL